MPLAPLTGIINVLRICFEGDLDGSNGYRGCRTGRSESKGTFRPYLFARLESSTLVDILATGRSPKAHGRMDRVASLIGSFYYLLDSILEDGIYSKPSSSIWFLASVCSLLL